MQGFTPAPCLDEQFPGAVNLRDLGGLPAAQGRVRSGLLFRSGMTHQLEPAGLSGLRRRLGIRTVFDLRNDEELARDGIAAFAGHGIQHRRMAVYGTTAVSGNETPGGQQERFERMARREYDWCARYQTLVTEYPASFLGFLRALAEPGALPALFHCSAGRDRTGVAAALLLSLLGVADDVIAADYARTGALLLPHLFRYGHISAGRLDEAQLAALLSTEAPVMLRFLAWLRSAHGGAEALLARHGLAAAEVQVLRDIFLEG